MQMSEGMSKILERVTNRDSHNIISNQVVLN